MQVFTHSQPIILICGVPGSGKTWVADQLKHKYAYLPHDSHHGGDYARALMQVAATSDKPVLGDVPFAERVLVERLKSMHARVHPVFIIEHPRTIKQRYEAREHKPVSESTMSRASTIVDRAREWRAKYGTSEEILNYLKGL